MRKKLDDKLKSNPFSHYCSKPNECIEQVVQTGKNVYIHVILTVRIIFFFHNNLLSVLSFLILLAQAKYYFCIA